MMRKIVITSGESYTDIDTLGCALAYRELLMKEGRDVKTVLPGLLNTSVTAEVRSWNPEFETEARDVPVDANFVIVDVSEPEAIAGFVDQDKICEIYDHHSGFEEYWGSKPNVKTVIEKIGACATIIWEEWKKRQKNGEISQASARMLYAAIVSNTLNFKASVTDERDITAAGELEKISGLGPDFIGNYFREQEKEVFSDPEKAVSEDVKSINFPNLSRRIAIGQLELWRSAEFIDKYLKEVKTAMEKTGNEYWFFTSPSISEDKNYLYAKNDEVKALLENVLGIKFAADMAQTKKLILRKEINKLLQAYNGSNETS